MEGPLASLPAFASHAAFGARFSHVKASLVTIAAAVLAAAMLFPARADDVGAHPDLRALRGAAPILAGHVVGAPLAVDDVVVDGNAALVTWRAAGKNGVAVFKRRSDRWWLAGTYDAYGPASGLATAQLARTFAVPESLVALARAHVAGFATQTPVERHGVQPLCAACPSILWNEADGFETTLSFTAATPRWDPSFAIRGRAPTVAEMPPTPAANAYFFFRISTQGKEPVAVAKGARLDVWFPYVLDSSRNYVLWLDFLHPDIDGIPGTLDGNTLHFTLPAFETIPGKEAFGEIDGA
jgi:hypothetical protein